MTGSVWEKRDAAGNVLFRGTKAELDAFDGVPSLEWIKGEIKELEAQLGGSKESEGS